MALTTRQQLLFNGAILIFAIAISVLKFQTNIKLFLVKTFYSTANSTIFSNHDLEKYNGIINKELYLSILGTVFDVSDAPSYYGDGGTYNYFVGKDATRSFVSGDFKGSPRDDVADLSKDDLRAVIHWHKFYNEKYKKKGILIGRYYNEKGLPTEYGLLVKKLIEGAINEKKEDEVRKKEFPPCNVEWNPDSGTHVWCTNQSGGISRNWDGVPRQLFELGATESRCACVRPEHLHLKNLKEYQGCKKESPSCYIKVKNQ